MLGAGLQFNRSRNGEDQFYSAARARRSQDHLRRSQNRSQADVTPEKTKGVAASPMFEPASSCNLERFLESITPSVPAQRLSKTALKEWRTSNENCQPYFVLADLWESFKEWSVYGAGVPLIMNDSDLVVQYYVPYLSGIQLYVDPSRSMENSRRLGEESDGDYFRDSSSEGSSDCEQDRGSFNHSIEQRSYHHQTSNNACRVDPLSMRDQAYQESFSSDESDSGSSQSRLLFEYLERDQPYSREPLADKICDLALRFPELKMLRSCDLLPSSWISVAWIPMGPTLEDLDACFLTFHSLHTPLPGSETIHTPLVSYSNEREDGVPKISLPVFGLATYKYKVSLWTPNAGYQRQLVTSLLQDADDRLKLLQVNHPDFLFFSSK
ncbi:uncharacterized protein LOC111396308 isoform X2 [Olea europaea var. sylvestris]|uniref:uncharacterized protein LOC111396308 isoform X2 n=1 Tax=Olea europaea var. sylvestris TaxID=158386 RepID=UPI000C1D2A07|nr:uncharacterized protein LOC111396308 isoform X2 [Olea europaea var. sylvestris]